MIFGLWIKLKLLLENFRSLKYYGKSQFRKADLLLLRQYLFRNPYKISKEFLVKKGEKEVYAYGETPLTTLDLIVRACHITPADTVFELGCGRGRGCFWLSCYLGCRTVGVEYIPEFVLKAKKVQQTLKIANLEFRLGDILEADYSGATVLYLYGTCYDDPFLKQLIKRFKKLPKGIKIISISYPLTDYAPHLFEVTKVFEAPFTWGVGHVYLQQIL